MNRNIILKTFDEVRYFRKRLIFAIELKEKVTFLILSNEPIFDIETLRNYLIENELNQFAKNEIINLIELIDSFLKLKIKYEAVPKSENHFSYEYPNKGKGVGGGNLMYVLKVNDNFLKVNEATFSEKEPLYSRFTSLNCFNISSRLLEIKDLFATYLEQPQQPEPEAIDLIDTNTTEKIKKNEDKNWFKVGLLFATGEINDLLKKFENNASAIARHKGNKSFRPHITESLGASKETSSQSVYYPDNFKIIYNHCKENDIKITPEFKAYYSKIELSLN